MSDSYDAMDCGLPDPLSMGFPRPEYWNGLPFPSPGNLPDPRTEPRFSALQANALTAEPRGKPPIAILLLFHLKFLFCTFTTSTIIPMKMVQHTIIGHSCASLPVF